METKRSPRGSPRAYTPTTIQQKNTSVSTSGGKINKSVGSLTSGSAYNSYYNKLRVKSGWFGGRTDEDQFNPTVVQTVDEFDDMLRDIATRCPMTLRTVHLPPGLNMNDPRLRGNPIAIKNVKSEVLPVGQMPQLPNTPFISDLPKDLVSPDWYPRGLKGGECRFQVITEELLPNAQANGEASLKRGRKDAISEPLTEKALSPREVPGHAKLHRRISESVEAEERNLSRRHAAQYAHKRLLAPPPN